MSDIVDDGPSTEGLGSAKPDHDVVGQASGSVARKIAAVVGVIVIAMIALLARGGVGEQPEEANSLLGLRVPAMAGEAVDGRSYDIDDLRGEWVLVNFFGTWCPPCVAEHPELVELEQWGEANDRLSLVSVAFNDNPADVQQFFDDFGGEWPVLDDANLSVAFEISNVPESFLIAPSGLVVQHFIGGIVAGDVTQSIVANDLPVSQGGVGQEPAPATSDDEGEDEED